MLKNRVAIITGGSKGIGRAIAEKFAKNKCNIVINYRNDNDKTKVDTVAKELSKYGVETLVVKGDISIAEDCKSIVKETVNKFGQLDILVNNAGITNDKLVLRMSEDDFGNVIDINLKGSFNMIKNSIRPMMKSKNGRIINISSVIGLMGNAGQANYAASKSGLFGLSKSIAREYASRSITCNSVCPGFIQSAMTDKLSDEVSAEYKKKIPLGRYGQPEDVANVCLFLASDMASYITGQELTVDGGMVM